MNRFLYFTILCFLSTVIQAQSVLNESSGVKWAVGLSWQEVLHKAKLENKYLFVDCYTTWCGPCKAMEKNVYPLVKVGNAVNKKFIAVKVQMDKTPNDNSEIKAWYTDIKKIERDFDIKAYPTLLFFSPEGKLVHKVSQGYNAEGFIDLLSTAVDPKKQYYTILARYQSGEKDTAFMRTLATSTKNFGDQKLALQIAEDYLTTIKPKYLYNEEIKEFVQEFHESQKAKTIATDFISQLKDKEIYTASNIKLIRQFTQSSKDRGFKIFYENSSKINKITDAIPLPPGIYSFVLKGDYAQSLVRNIIYTEIIYQPIFYPVFTSGAKIKPDWKILKQEIKKKYPLVDADRIIIDARIVWYQWEKNEPEYSSSLIEKMNKVYTSNNLIGNSFIINNDCWSLFESSMDSSILNRAIYWMEQMFNQNEDAKKWSIAIDTYANLLYKVGRKEDALIFEEKAVNLKPTENDFQKALEKMKKGEPTWSQQRRNFSGLWRINVAKSEYGQAPVNTLIKEMKVDQAPDQISIERKAGDEGKESTSKETLTFDGKVTEQKFGTQIKKASVKWPQDGKEMIENAFYDSEQDQMDRKLTETWSLSSNGKILVVIRNIELNSGPKYSTKCVYEKED